MFCISGARITSAAAAAVAKRAVVRGSAFRGMATVGDKVPNIEMHKGFPPDKINLPEYCAGKKLIMLGLPGAFT